MVSIFNACKISDSKKYVPSYTFIFIGTMPFYLNSCFTRAFNNK